MTKDLLQLQKFIEGSDIIHDTDGAITFVLHDLFKLKKDGSPRSKVKLFAFLEKVVKKDGGQLFQIECELPTKGFWYRPSLFTNVQPSYNIAREDELSKILCDLKNLALSQKVPILITSQLKRELEERTNKRQMLSDLRESDQIENYADFIAFIYRDEYYNPETEERGITEIIVTKQKDGPVGTVKLLFEPQYTRFRNLAI